MKMKAQTRSSTFATSLFMTLAISTLSGCYMEVHENKDDDKSSGRSSSTTSNKLPLSADPSSQFCSADEIKQSRYPDERIQMCFMKDDFKWRTSCTSAECVDVPIFVSYMLSDDLGTGTNVAVEAFDNPRFVGAPVSSVQLTSFDASAAGRYQRASLFLKPGMYYLRAFIADEGDAIVPYQYQNMQVVREKPMGVAGALSSPAPVTVAPQSRTSAPQSPVHIVIDKLFRLPGQNLDTEAFMRIRFSMQETSNLSVGRDVIIGLYPDSDITQAPSAQFKMPTERLLITGQVGTAEFVTPELEVGNYVVFAWVDSNGNGFHDESEPKAMSMRNGQPYALAVSKRRTIPLQLDLVGQSATPAE